jgi:hypothetical protein
MHTHDLPARNLLPQLQDLAALVGTVESAAAQTECWTNARNLHLLANALKEVLEFSTTLPGALEGAAPWNPRTDADRKQ